jgi:hypothetical protein
MMDFNNPGIFLTTKTWGVGYPLHLVFSWGKNNDAWQKSL